VEGDGLRMKCGLVLIEPSVGCGLECTIRIVVLLGLGGAGAGGFYRNNHGEQ